MERNRIRSVGVRASKKEKKYEKNRLDLSFVLGIAAVARGTLLPASIEFIELGGNLEIIFGLNELGVNIDFKA